MQLNMNKDSLLNECEQLSYNDRTKRMFELGRNAATHAPTRDMIEELLLGSLYENSLGLQTCYGSRDARPALLALRSSSNLLKNRAIPLIVLHANDTEILSILHLIPFKLIVSLIHRLKKRRRFKLVDASVQRLAVTRDDIKLYKKLLPLASDSLVESGLPQVLDLFDVYNWTALFKGHPYIASKYLRSWILQMESPDRPLLDTINLLLPRMAEIESMRSTALDIVKLMLNLVPLAQLAIQNLLRKCPQQVAQLILESEETLGQNNADFTLVAKSLRTEQLVTLYEKYPETVPFRCFFNLNPHQRLAVYNRLRQGWRDEMGKITSEVIGALPTKERITEARRHLNLPDFEIQPLLKLRYAAFLPWDEAIVVQAPFIRSNEADIRSAALSSQIATTIYQNKHLGDALKLVIQRRFEQEPVRIGMLAALQKLPPGSWEEEHLPDLATFIRNTLDTIDTSSTSIRLLLTFTTRLLLFHPAWSAKQLATILQEREQVLIRFQMFGNSSIKNAMSFFAEAMSPVLKTWHKRGKENLIWELAMALEEKLQHMPELLDILEKILQDTHTENIATNIFGRLAKYRAQRLGSLAPTLLELDTSFIGLDVVRDYVHTHLQPLLTQFFGPMTFEGRFSSSKEIDIIEFYNGFEKWTKAQQEVFATTLAETLKEPERPAIEARKYLRQLGSLCFVDDNPLIYFASDERPVVQEYALRALSSLDAGQGIPTLVVALDDERARVAIYALRKALKTMPDQDVMRILQTAPMRKVTVAKEVVRLIGELGSNDAYQYLVKTGQDNLHPDVRVALLRGLWSYLERPQTWEIFERAAQDPDPSIAAGVVKIPLDGASKQARDSFLKLALHLISHPLVEVQLLTLGRCDYDPPADPHQILAPRILSLLKSPLRDVVSRAASTFFSMYNTTEATLITNTFRLLLKDRQSLTFVFEAYFTRLYSNNKFMLPTTRLILDVLKPDLLSLSLRLRLIFHALPSQEILHELLALGPYMHADALVKAEALVEGLSKRPDVNIAELEVVLAGSDDEKLRRLALSALLARSKFVGEGWTDELRERLRMYQNDRSLLVAEAANFIFPPTRSE